MHVMVERTLSRRLNLQLTTFLRAHTIRLNPGNYIVDAVHRVSLLNLRYGLKSVHYIPLGAHLYVK